jgi:hypothetical protein
MRGLIPQDGKASINGLAGQLSNFYFYPMSNECAINREKLYWSINSLKYMIFMAESYQIKAFVKTYGCAPLNGVGSKLSRQLYAVRKKYPVRKRISGLD